MLAFFFQLYTVICFSFHYQSLVIFVTFTVRDIYERLKDDIYVYYLYYYVDIGEILTGPFIVSFTEILNEPINSAILLDKNDFPGEKLCLINRKEK